MLETAAKIGDTVNKKLCDRISDVRIKYAGYAVRKCSN